MGFVLPFLFTTEQGGLAPSQSWQQDGIWDLGLSCRRKLFGDSKILWLILCSSILGFFLKFACFAGNTFSLYIALFYILNLEIMKRNIKRGGGRDFIPVIV